MMTAMPPTLGHLQLIQFASRLADRVRVLVCTQPHEPMPLERYQAIARATMRILPEPGRAVVTHYNRTIEQNPEAPGFWEKWQEILKTVHVDSDTIIVASEPYGQRLAELTGAKFFPYDIDRQLNSIKATKVRKSPLHYFDQIIPEFQPYLRTTVTIFGAESTGKTTLARLLGSTGRSQWLFEWARPYLEHTVNEITPDSMRAIHQGQKALQLQGQELPVPLVIQDTDLYSTLGYWQLPHWAERLGEPPIDLEWDAEDLKSDHYLITPSNIPFESDPLRYGGTVREGSDEYWIEICERYKLSYTVLQGHLPSERWTQAEEIIADFVIQKTELLAYDRQGY